MEIIQWLGYTMIPICIIISILLMIYGTTRHIKYLDPKVPLGRLFYFFCNADRVTSKCSAIALPVTGPSSRTI